jgi:hypothetical protein
MRSAAQRLIDASAWCSRLSLTADPPEPPEALRRRRLADEAVRALEPVRGLPYDKFSKTPEYARFQALIHEAAVWELCPLEKQLRSEELRPDDIKWPRSAQQRRDVVDRLAERRAEKLGNPAAAAAPGLTRLGGRLLLFNPDLTLSDGCARSETKGFYDDENTPPWDLWLSYEEPHLVCWVPPVLAALAGIGVEVNPEECITWATPGRFTELERLL